MPPRTEVTLEIDLPEDERAFYEAMRQRALEALAELSETGGGQNRIHILAEITKLRRACCHPGLIDPATTLSGAKLEAFLDLVDDLIRNKHKALVFSQFVGQLERVREALLSRGVSHQYLDGGTPASEREKRVAAFQAGEGDLFLISLRAGGTGLNPTAAGSGQRPRPPHRPTASRHRLASDLLEGTDVSAKLSEEDLLNLMRV